MAITSVPEAVLDNHVRLAGQVAVAEEPGRVVRALRERFGFTQETLARLLRMRRESLSRVEGGRVAPSGLFIQRFAGIIALTQAVREHLAGCEARSLAVDQGYLRRVALGLRMDPALADEAILAAMMGYEQKKRGVLRVLEESA